MQNDFARWVVKLYEYIFDKFHLFSTEIMANDRSIIKNPLLLWIKL